MNPPNIASCLAVLSVDAKFEHIGVRKRESTTRIRRSVLFADLVLQPDLHENDRCIGNRGARFVHHLPGYLTAVVCGDVGLCPLQ